jgi:hypothetical protein
VSRNSFITTPNRWYPIEFHTVLPLVHWLPPDTFRALLKKLKMDFYAQESNLNLLTEKELIDLLPSGVTVKTYHFRLLGPVSHLVLHLTAP